MGTERGGCSRLMKTPRHNGGAVHSRSMRANDEVQEIVRYALNTPYAREYIRKLRATSGLY